MALVTCLRNDVTEAVIYMPRQGVWNAEVVVDGFNSSQYTVGSSAPIVIGAGQLTLNGTVRQAGAYLNSFRIRIVGGAGGLTTQATPKYYGGEGNGNVSIRDVIKDLLKGATNPVTPSTTETLSSTADTTTLALPLTSWTTIQQPSSVAISSLLLTAGSSVAWRILPDGTFWCGPETYPAVSSSYVYDLVGARPNEKYVEIASAVPLLLPGYALPFGNISYLEHHILPASCRTQVWLE